MNAPPPRPPIAALCALVTTVTLSPPAGADEPSSPPVSPPPAVKLVRPGPVDAPVERAFQGRVVAKDTLDLAFEVGGELVELPLVEGERLARGAPVASLDLAPFERAVRRAELALDQAERAHERASALVAGNATSRASAEDAETARDLAVVALADAREALADAQLSTPFDALVAARLVAPHTIIEPGVPIARLHDLSETRVEIDVAERLVNALPSIDHVRFEAVVTGGGDGDGNDAIPLQLVGLETETGPVGQSYTVTLKLHETPARPTPLPGSSMTVTARLPATGEDGMRLPASALLSGDDRDAAVMVFEPDGTGAGTVARMPVEVGSRTGASLQVSGIGADVEIVAAGAHRLQDGDQVRRWNGLVVAEDRP